MGGSNARVGRSDFLVVESDESDGSFLKLAPIMAVVTNIDREHLDHYPSLDDIRRCVHRVRQQGAVLRRGDPLPRRRPTCRASCRRSGAAPSPTARRAGGYRGDRDRLRPLRQRLPAASSASADLGRFHLGVPGRHNVLNAMAAVAVALELEVEAGHDPRRRWPPSAASTGAFRCAARSAASRWWTITATIPPRSARRWTAARLCGFRRIQVLFQPHRYTRTFHLMDEFARAFHQADSVFVLDIYAASEKPIEGVTAEALVERIRAVRPPRRPSTRARSNAASRRSLDAAREGDLVLTLGAGNVWQAGDTDPGGACGRGKLDGARRRTETSGAVRFAGGSGLTAFGWLAVLRLDRDGRRARWSSSSLTDPQFTLSRDQRGRASPSTALKYASRSRWPASSRRTFGRSIFSIPLEERRRRLLAIDWVEDASVSRIWPNRCWCGSRSASPWPSCICRCRERRASGWP